MCNFDENVFFNFSISVQFFFQNCLLVIGSCSFSILYKLSSYDFYNLKIHILILSLQYFYYIARSRSWWLLCPEWLWLVLSSFCVDFCDFGLNWSLWGLSLGFSIAWLKTNLQCGFLFVLKVSPGGLWELDPKRLFKCMFPGPRHRFSGSVGPERSGLWGVSHLGHSDRALRRAVQSASLSFYTWKRKHRVSWFYSLIARFRPLFKFH